MCNKAERSGGDKPRLARYTGGPSFPRAEIMLNSPKSLFCAIAAALFCTTAQAGGYAIDSANSALNFVSVKNNAVAETHRFGSVSGGVAEDGSAEVFIALATVDTGIEIRDTRMRNVLFNVPEHPLAQLKATVPTQALAALADGEPQSLDLRAILELAGQSGEITLPVLASPSKNGGLLVVTRQPVLVQAEAFGLDAGINKLREIAGLNAIATAVPVTFLLHLSPVD